MLFIVRLLVAVDLPLLSEFRVLLMLLVPDASLVLCIDLFASFDFFRNRSSVIGTSCTTDYLSHSGSVKLPI